MYNAVGGKEIEAMAEIDPAFKVDVVANKATIALGGNTAEIEIKNQLMWLAVSMALGVTLDLGAAFAEARAAGKPLVGLGLRQNMGGLQRLGVTTWDSWWEEGLTQVRPWEANSSAEKFALSFAQAMSKAGHIVFDLTDIDVARALKDGASGVFASGNATNAELYAIANDANLLSKTTFIIKGIGVVKPIFTNGVVTGFAK